MTGVVWAPQPGSQQYFLACPYSEILYHGTRGPGKTDALLMRFVQNVGKGYGAWWRGAIFREQHVQLMDVKAKAQRWFRRFYPAATYNGAEAKWTFPDGAELLLRHICRPDDYWKFHGWELPFLGWEELTNWPMPDCFEAMQSCNRSSGPPEMPRETASTCNPFGVGHHWVKFRYIDPAPDGQPIVDELSGKTRVAIKGSIYENKILMENDPGYLANLKGISDKNKRDAWLDGSWDIVAAGFLEGVYDKQRHVLRPFVIPPSWYVDRAFDWGSSKPYSVGWYAESDGEPFDPLTGMRPADDCENIYRFPRGTVFRIAELYGWNGKPNQGCHDVNRKICEKILAAERGLIRDGGILRHHARVYPGPADSSIFDVINGDSYADEMAREGVEWLPAYKGSGSRVQGWQRMRNMCAAVLVEPAEEPGFYVFDTCTHWIRTVPVLVRDDKKLDDVDTDQEDHCGDETRYRIMPAPREHVGVTKLGWAR